MQMLKQMKRAYSNVRDYEEIQAQAHPYVPAHLRSNSTHCHLMRTGSYIFALCNQNPQSNQYHFYHLASLCTLPILFVCYS